MSPLKSVSKHLRRLILQSKSGQGEHVLVEGERFFLTASALSSKPPSHLLASCPRLLARLRDGLVKNHGPAASPTDCVLVTESLLANLSDVVSPPPCLAVFPKPLLKSPIIGTSGPDYSVLCWDVADPSNIGGIARLSWCLGARRLLVTPRCANPWMPKALRSGAGAHFALPVATWEVDKTPSEDAKALGSAFSRILIAWPSNAPCGRVINSDMRLTDALGPEFASSGSTGGSTCLLLGSEARGLPEALTSALTQSGVGTLIHVPMAEAATEVGAALNVSAACAILLHRLQCLGKSPAVMGKADMLGDKVTGLAGF